ncbi:MAG TPA: hypothetical protein DCX07_13445 [Phycisphaerales bacterium]|nr:hypothetical protein [Phycisphaerales bacterium]
MKTEFVPDYRNVLAAARNERPPRLPLYEHLINVPFMEKYLNTRFPNPFEGGPSDRKRHFEMYCDFYRRMGYDTVSFEMCVTCILPGGGALVGERAGVIQTRADFERYPWADLPRLYWDQAEPQFEMLGRCLPEGMKAIGGVGNGVFEISEDLVGFEQLCYLQVDDPELFSDLYRRIGDVLMTIWARFLERFGGMYAVCRIGDDMGFKTGTLLAPQALRDHVVPQYRRIIKQVHDSGHPFLLHSCGRIFDVMDAMIEAGIDAKHSNEDAIAPYDEWVRRYGGRIGLFGGIDTDVLCRKGPDEIYAQVLEDGARFRATARGFALGSGNSIPEYVSVEGYDAMIRAVRELRRREGTP